MADAVSTTVNVAGDRIVTLSFMNVSDGTGESAVAKVAAATYGTNVCIRQMWYSTAGMSVKILWDADTDVPAWVVPADRAEHFDFRSFGGLKNNAGTGVTGSINFTTVGHSSGDSYNIVLEIGLS